MCKKLATTTKKSPLFLSSRCIETALTDVSLMSAADVGGPVDLLDLVSYQQGDGARESKRDACLIKLRVYDAGGCMSVLLKRDISDFPPSWGFRMRMRWFGMWCRSKLSCFLFFQSLIVVSARPAADATSIPWIKVACWWI